MTTLLVLWHSLSFAERFGIVLAQIAAAAATYLFTVRIFG